uniref:WD repeat-containing protein 65 n=1 Tax=Mucochytrium quahogii TaxID=96639 RepID=A0A7S2RY67_9STRA|mmetsp:Transcript_2183/g.4438  ORF Transcript_2183/g.4438 Transcript_2183/m.4438 type:complete len:843 (+) Transcript_2183:3-2531(+)
MDDIRTYKEFPVKGSKDCKFSNGGQYFAAANGSVIQVYHTYTFESLLILRGHAGKVHSIGWTEDDRMLVSCGADGVIYRWSIKDGKKTGEYISKGSNLMCTRPSNDECTASLSTGKPDTRLTEIQLDSSSKFELIGPQGLGFDQICVSHSGKSVFAGLFDNTGSKMSKDGSENTVGSTVKLSLPLSSNQSKDSKPPPTADTHDKDGVEDTFGNVKEADNVYELQLDKLNRFAAHSGNITRMCVSHDDQYLFSVGDDGTLAIYLISEESDGSRKNREKEAMIQYAEEILVTKSDLEEKTNLMHELKTKVNELTLHNEYQLRLKDMNYNEKIKDVTKKFTEELDQDRSKYDKLRKEKLCMEDMFKDRLEKMESAHNNQLKTIEQTYQEKIDAEIKRFDELVQEREQLALRWDEQNHVLVESHEKYVNEVTEEFEDKLARELKERDQIEKKKQVLMNQFEDSKQEVEEDADIEIEELKEKYVAKLTVEREATLRLKGENGIMKKKFSSLQNDIEEQKDRIKQLTEREMDLYEGIKGLEKDIHGHKKEIKEREETIQDKEKRIYDLKKKNQELEKFKFVLDYKIKELKRQIEPRENEIADMRHQIKEMDLELEQYQKSNAALDLMIGELRLKIDGMQKEIDTQTEALEQGKLAADQCKLELHQAMQVLNDHHLLKNRVVEMYKSYIQSAADENGQPKEKKATKKDTDRDKQPETHTGASVQREYNRQREYLEKSVESLKRKLTKDMKMHQADKMRLLRESVDLTNEINTLRRELHSLKRSKVGTRTRKSHIVAELDTESKESTATRRTVPSPTKTSEASREIELQRQQIHALTQQVNRLEHGLGIK